MNCVTKYCINDAQHGRYCHKCKNRKYRAKNKISSAYQILKDHARQRFIEFAVTKEYWKKICLDTMYHELRGNEAGSLTVDRPDVTRGYADDNIQVMTRIKNVEKQHTVDRKRKVEVMAMKYKTEGAPF